MNKEVAIAKINKMGKVGCIIAKIMKIILILSVVLVGIAIVILMILPKDIMTFSIVQKAEMTFAPEKLGVKVTDEDINDMVNSMNNDGDLVFSIGNVHLPDVEMQVVSTENHVVSLAGESEKSTIKLGYLVPMLVVAEVAVIATLISIIFIGKLCKAFKECQSPFEENVIMNMQKFAYSLIPWVILSGLSESMISSVVSGKLEFYLGVNLGVVFIVLIILALAYIFRYGAILQQESDETL